MITTSRVRAAIRLVAAGAGGALAPMPLVLVSHGIGTGAHDSRMRMKSMRCSIGSCLSTT
jgi:predicted dienelactone hydrolase